MRDLVCFLLFGVFLFSCRSGNEKNDAVKLNHTIKETAFRDSLKKVNRYISHKESMLIDAYVERHDYKMDVSGTGLRYMIYKRTKGELAQSGKRAVVNYTVSLLNGTVCYTSNEKGAEEFLIDQDEIESGLHEGIKYMRVGEKALFILPPHLAHGLIGDSEKIPPLTTVVYDIELINLKDVQ